MRRENQNWNFLENDQFNIQKSQDFIPNTQRKQFPFKIGSNFIQDDSQNISFIQSQNISIDYSLNHINVEEVSSKQEPNFRYSQEQIMKINKLNQKIRIMIVFENEFKEQIKRKLKTLANEKERIRDFPKDFIQQSKKQLEKFANNFSDSKIQPIKFNRISMITAEKKFFFLNKKDKYEVKKRKQIQILISEKDLQLQQKSGLLNPTEKGKDFKQTAEQAQNYIKESVSLINSNQLRTTVKYYVHQQLNELKEKIKKKIDENRKIASQLNQEIKKLANNLTNNQQAVNDYNLVKEMQIQKKIISNSENLLEVVPVKRLFSFMPNFKQENFLNLHTI